MAGLGARGHGLRIDNCTPTTAAARLRFSHLRAQAQVLLLQVFEFPLQRIADETSRGRLRLVLPVGETRVEKPVEGVGGWGGGGGGDTHVGEPPDSSSLSSAALV